MHAFRPVLAALIASCAASLCTASASAQDEAFELPPGLARVAWAAAAPHRLAGPLDDFARLLEVARRESGSRLLRRLSDPDSASWRLTLGLLPASTRFLGNSAYASTLNDGLVWAGRGASLAASAGARVAWGPFSAAFAPELAWQQNRSFPIHWNPRPGLDYFAYAHGPDIDFPQRFGDDSFSKAGPGGSYARVDAFGAAFGVSTENLWWGPATRYPILMSNTAAGFPHYFLGTTRPLDVGIGRIEAELVLGRLAESDYFDQDEYNDRTGLIGLVGAFYPRWPEGLSLGFARAYQYREPPDDWTFNEQAVRGMFGLGDDNRTGNDLVSLFARWVLAEGVEVYGEWAREDRFNDFAELLQEPDHSLAYLLGFQQVHSITRRWGLRTLVEFVSLQQLAELRLPGRPLPVFYKHSAIRQGYTHGGQLLGAWIGPGGDGQFIAVDALSPFGLGGLFLERVRRANASGAAIMARMYSPYEHDTEITFGLRALYPALPHFVVTGSLARSFRYNREFLLGDAVNWNLQLEVAWTPPRDP